MRREDGLMTLGELATRAAHLYMSSESVVIWGGDYDEHGVGGVRVDKDGRVVIHSTGRIGL